LNPYPAGTPYADRGALGCLLFLLGSWSVFFRVFVNSGCRAGGYGFVLFRVFRGLPFPADIKSNQESHEKDTKQDRLRPPPGNPGNDRVLSRFISFAPWFSCIDPVAPELTQAPQPASSSRGAIRCRDVTCGRVMSSPAGTTEHTEEHGTKAEQDLVFQSKTLLTREYSCQLSRKELIILSLHFH
jgi:hypothetical protein